MVQCVVHIFKISGVEYSDFKYVYADLMILVRWLRGKLLSPIQLFGDTIVHH